MYGDVKVDRVKDLSILKAVIDWFIISILVCVLSMSSINIMFMKLNIKKQ